MSSKHILGNFEKALEELRSDVLIMASTAEKNLNDAVTGLLNRQPDLCADAIANDEEVDQLELRIDHEGMRVLSLFQPVARDLRSVVSSMRMATNLERVSDEAGNISRRARKMLKNPELAETKTIEPLFRLAAKLLHESIRAFADGDVTAAATIEPKDDEVDDAYKRLRIDLTTRMEDDTSRLKDYLDLIFIARSLERVGDHATNIAEDTIYHQDGKDIRHQA